LAYRIETTSPAGSTHVVTATFSQAETAYDPQLISSYWATRVGVTWNVLANIRQHLEENLHDLAFEASLTMVARLTGAEHEVIGILNNADATGEYRARMTAAEAREALDEQAGIFEMEDMDLELWFFLWRLGTILVQWAGVL
jgi:hypothetical protein